MPAVYSVVVPERSRRKYKASTMKFFGVLVLAFVFVAFSDARKDFTGDQVLTLYPKTDFEANFIKSLNKEYELVDFWKPKYAGEVGANNEVDIRFARSHLAHFKSLLESRNIEYKVKIVDVQALVNNQVKGRQNAAIDSLVHNYNVFHPNDEIVQWIQDIAAAYPSLVSVDNLGKTTEDRDIYMFKISTNPNNPAVFIDCTFHAREWISPAVCQCFTRNLLEGYGNDPVFTRHLDELTYYIIPVVNVDGYVWSWEENRMWRKTRSDYGNTCIGVDANRNLDINWGGQGASHDSCDETYCGPNVESEPEVKVFSDFLRANSEHIMVYLSMHSYGQLFSLPWSYTFVPPPTLRELNKFSQQATEEMKKPFGSVYTYGSGSSNLYLVSGGTKDYAYILTIPYSTTIELRDDGQYGFLLPEDQIEPTCIEVTAGLRVLSDAAMELSYNRQNAK